MVGPRGFVIFVFQDFERVFSDDEGKLFSVWDLTLVETVADWLARRMSPLVAGGDLEIVY